MTPGGIMKSIFLCVVILSLYAGACSTHEPQLDEMTCRLPSATIDEFQVEGEVRFSTVGAVSKKFEKHIKEYPPLRITLVAGASLASIAGGDGSFSSTVIGIESPQGKAILRILDDEQPWGWDGAKGHWFADGLYFSGRLRGHEWEYRSVYPDEKLTVLLIRLRRELPCCQR